MYLCYSEIEKADGGLFMEYKCFYESAMGRIVLTSDGENLTSLWFTTSRFSELCEIEKEQFHEELPVFHKTCRWLDAYFKGQNPKIDIPMRLSGSAFCLRVWEILKTIPYGQTITYGDIAKQIAAEQGKAKMSAQAVGYAVGHNPISIIIPCHRVVGAKGNLTGYGGGLDKKIQLLTLENVAMDAFYRPKKGTAL